MIRSDKNTAGGINRGAGLFPAVLFSFLAVFCVTARGAVTVDAVSSTSGDGSSYTWSHTCGGSQRLLIVGISGQTQAASVAYGGQALTFIRRDVNFSFAISELWYLLDPPSGTYEVSVTMEAADDTVCGAISFTGVDQSEPLGTSYGTTGRSTQAYIRVFSQADEVVVDNVCFRGGDGNPVVGAGQTERWQIQSGGGWDDVEGGCSTEAGAAQVDMTWGFSSRDRWAISAVAVKPYQGGNFQASYRWADDTGYALEAENTVYTMAGVNQRMHLRAGVRAQGQSWFSHRLALQYADNPDFTGAQMVTPASSNICMWDDLSHADGDAMTSAHLLSGSPQDGEFHETNETSSQVKSADVLYEEDFTVQSLAAGVWYLRVVEVDSNGDFLSLLDGYTHTIELTVNPTEADQTGFAWSPDASAGQGGLPWNAEDTEVGFEPGEIFILGVQMSINVAGGNQDWQLQYQQDYDTVSPGPWTAVDNNSLWHVDGAHLCTIADGETIFTSSYSQSTEAGYTAAAGQFSDDNRLNASFASGGCVELWYAISADEAARGHSYRFRVLSPGAVMGFNIYATTRSAAVEQVSFRWLESNEGPAAVENDHYQTVQNVKLHLRMGIRSNQASWNGKSLALQFADNTDFTGAALVTPSSATFRTWDDPDHTNGDYVSGVKMLSGSPSDGKYHESNVTSPQDFAANTLYEVDFTVQVNYIPTYNQVDEWYFRVVEVDAGGASPAVIDMYSEVVRLDVTLATNRQSAYNWSPDGSILSWEGVDQPLQFTAGGKYILAVQYERVYSGDSSDWQWVLQYQEDPDGTPGSWTDVTYSSQYWRTTGNTETYNGHNNGDSIATGDFVCGTGTGTAYPGEYSNDDNGITYAFTGDTYIEFWYALEVQPEAENRDFAFRIIRNEGTEALEFKVFPRAVNISDQQISYRWTDADEAALGGENSSVIAATSQNLHLRAGVKRQGADWGTHYLGLQWDDNSSFSSPEIVSASSSPVAAWDDPDHSDGDTVAGTVLSGSPSAGGYHESNATAAQTRTADVLYEEDFSLSVSSPGTYYLRVVEVDSGGALVDTLDYYQNTVQLEVVDPFDTQTGYNWAPDEDISPALVNWQGENTALSFTAGETYLLAVQVQHSSDAASDYDWVLQYQKDPDGSPGAWTSVTNSSADWQTNPDCAFSAIANEGVVDALHFRISSPGGTSTDGEFSSDSNGATHMLSGNVAYTEYWYAVTPQSTTAGSKYRFRVTSSGSTYGLSYSVYPIAAQVSVEQASCRWADAGDVALAGVNESISVAAGDQVHLRVGVRVNNGTWNGHSLGLEFADNPSFSGASVMVEGSGGLLLWDDADHTNAAQLSGTKLLSDSAQYGYWHETDDGQPSEDFPADTLVEEDFAVQAAVNGTYYIRVIEVDSSGAKVGLLDTYSQTIQLTVAAPADRQSGCEWGLDTAASPDWQGDDAAIHFAAGGKYILAVQIWHQSEDPSVYDWQLQYQEWPYVFTPGAWTTITASSSCWRTVSPDNVAKSNEGSVTTGEFGYAAPPGAAGAVDGEFSDDSNGAQYTISSNNYYTELWFCISPTSSASGKQYRFRVTDAGSPSLIQYDVYAFAYDVRLWDGSADTGWNTAGNWTPAAVPPASDDVRVPSASNYANAPVITVATNSLNTLTLDAGGTTTVSSGGTLNAGGNLDVYGTLTSNAGNVSVGGNLTVYSGGTVNLNAGSVLSMGGGSSIVSNGTFNADGTGWDAGQYVTLQSSSGFYSATVAAGGMDHAYINDTDGNGLKLTGDGGAYTLSQLRFSSAVSGAGTQYMWLTGAWGSGTTLTGFSFDASATPDYAIRFDGADASGTVSMDYYDDTGLYGDAETYDSTDGASGSGTISWASPTSVQFAGGSIVDGGGFVRVDWSTRTEFMNSGFAVLRRTEGSKWERIAYIRGAGYSIGLRKYSYIDWNVRTGATYEYVILDMDARGRCTRHKLGAVTLGRAHGVPLPARLVASQVPSRREMGSHPRRRSIGHWFRSLVREPVKLEAARWSRDHGYEEDEGDAGPLPSPPAGAIKMATTGSGLVAVDCETLGVAGGAVVNRGNFVGSTRRGDQLIFYARDVGSRYTGRNAYWLIPGSGCSVWGGLPDWLDSRLGNVFRPMAVCTAYRETARAEDNSFYARNLPEEDGGDRFFSSQVLFAGGQASFEVNLSEMVAGGHALVRFSLMGFSAFDEVEPDHRVQILINGSAVGFAEWDGGSRFTGELDIDAGLISEGANEIGVFCPGDTGAPYELALIDWVEIEYERRLKMVDGRLEFSIEKPACSRVRLTGLSDRSPVIMDVTVPGAERLVPGLEVRLRNGELEAEFFKGAGPRRYAAACGEAIKAPLSVSTYEDRDLASIEADYLVVSHSSLMEPAGSIAARRRTQGLSTAVVDVEDAFDEFSWGVIDPEAVRKLVCAVEPQYLLLVGDSTFDTHGCQGDADGQMVPAYLAVQDRIGETADDNRFACLDGDDLPDIAVGRIPARNPEQVHAVLAKIEQFEAEDNSWNGPDALLVADDDEVTFSSDLDAAALSLERQFLSSEKAYLGILDVAEVNEAVVDSINQGTRLIVYEGHGYLHGWAHERFFTINDLLLLDNPGLFPVILAITCHNGIFVNSTASSDCMAEQFLFAADKGAVCFVASSGMAESVPQGVLMKRMMELVASGESLGRALKEAKRVLGNDAEARHIRATYVLFGDPAMRVFPAAGGGL